MPHDQVVTPRHLLEAQMLLERAGHGRFLRDLESREPEMANYLMENCSQLHGQLMALGGPARRTQRLYLQMEALLLVCLRAQRDAHRELWDDQDPPGPAPPRVTPFDPFPPATLLLAGPVDHYLPGYVLAATSGCPLCGGPHVVASPPHLANPARCQRGLRCLDCGTCWVLIYPLADLRPLLAIPAE